MCVHCTQSYIYVCVLLYMSGLLKYEERVGECSYLGSGAVRRIGECKE